MPKIIHRIFFNFSDGPDPFLSYLKTWEEQLPDFEIKLWDKHNLPLDLSPYTRAMAKEKNHAFLSDYFRCWLLLQYGGIYLDADIELLNGDKIRAIYDQMNDSNDFDFFIGIESVGNGMLTAHSMGCKANTDIPLLSFMMSLYDNSLSGPLQYAIKRFDMPFLISLFFLEMEKKSLFTETTNGYFTGIQTTKIINRMQIYPQDYFSPITTRNKAKIVSAFSDNTCLCHHFAATWKNSSQDMVEASLFQENLVNGVYGIVPDVIIPLKKRYGEKIKLQKPLWHLREQDIYKIERMLNFFIPYGSVLYKILKRKLF